MFRPARPLAAMAVAGLVLAACETDEDPVDEPDDAVVDDATDDAVDDEPDDAVTDDAADDDAAAEAPAADAVSIGVQHGPSDQSVDEVVELLSEHDLYHANIDQEQVVDAPFPSQLLLYRDTAVEVELISAEPQVALELPMRIQAYDHDGQTQLAANDPQLLAERYGLMYDDLEELQRLDEELQGDMLFAAGASETEVSDDTDLGFAMTEVASSHDDYATTLEQVGSAIDDLGLTVLTQIDHGTTLAEEGEDVGEMHLLLFADPDAGADALGAQPTAGLDLPQRVLLYETEEEGEDVVHVVYHHGIYFEERHLLADVDGADAVIDGLQANVDAIAEAVEADGGPVEDDDTDDDDDA